MLPYKAIDIWVSDHAVDRFMQRSSSTLKDPIKVRSFIKNYLLSASDFDIFEGKDGNYYVHFFEEKRKNSTRELFFLISKDSTVMTIKPMTIEQKMRMIR